MIAIRLAYRNLMGAGLRTFLNVLILSITYFVIIMQNGFLQGWNKQARLDSMEWETAQGQFWASSYDPYDPFSYSEAHDKIPPQVMESYGQTNVAPVLLSQATIYPEGRIQSIIIKGIDTRQEVLKIPVEKLKTEGDEIPALIGTRMAKSLGAEEGDQILVRWRDANGVFDATEVRIAGIFQTNVPNVDQGQIWISLDRLQSMKDLENEATYIVAGADPPEELSPPGWEFKDDDELLANLDQMIQTKSKGGAIFYVILLALALLAVFDTQVLSIFRRQKEIGTLIAMGMTRKQVIGVFTTEGAMYAILAVVLGAVYGIPGLWLLRKKGFPMPEAADDFGLPITETIIPAYSLALVAGTILLVLIATTIVSYLPARKIAKMNPTEAIRGKAL